MPSSSSTNRRRYLFHQLFKSVPLSENLLQVYRCAVQKDILMQGHLYISEHHVCFKANIFGWVTRIMLAFDDITAIQKRYTAKLIPNGLEIESVWATHVFTSFMSRNHAYLLLTDLWLKQRRQCPPCNKRRPAPPQSSKPVVLASRPGVATRPNHKQRVGWIPSVSGARRDDASDDTDHDNICMITFVVVLLVTHVYTAYYLFRILRQLSSF